MLNLVLRWPLWIKVLVLSLLTSGIAHSALPANKAIRPLAREIGLLSDAGRKVTIFFQDNAILDPVTETSESYEYVLRNLLDLLAYFKDDANISFHWLKVVDSLFPANMTFVAQLEAKVLDHYYRKVFQDHIITLEIDSATDIKTDWVFVENREHILREPGMRPTEVTSTAAENIMEEEGSKAAVFLGYEGPESGATMTADMLVAMEEEGGERVSVILASEFNIYRSGGEYNDPNAIEETAMARQDRIRAEDLARQMRDADPDYVTLTPVSEQGRARAIARGQSESCNP